MHFFEDVKLDPRESAIEKLMRLRVRFDQIIDEVKAGRLTPTEGDAMIGISSVGAHVDFEMAFTRA